VSGDLEFLSERTFWQYVDTLLKAVEKTTPHACVTSYSTNLFYFEPNSIGK
jgi:hypothetical protein